MHRTATHPRTLRSGNPGGTRLSLRPIALACAVLGRERGEALLEGLTPKDEEDALAVLHEFRAQASPVRHAWLSLELGPRPDADERVRGLLESAPPGLRHALLRCVAPYQRSLVPGGDAMDVSKPPQRALEKLAARLVREASG
ncbi:MAG: hypothetical protein L0Y64_15440 [Myxococcaceae bacterium]|nr:hypothetical protein [Myxococcaceae bacterium]